MNEERKRILQLLAAGKISASEAEELLESVGSHSEAAEPGSAVQVSKKLNWLRVKVNSVDLATGKTSDVNLRVPLLLIRGGAKLAALLPEKVRKEARGVLEAEGMQFDLAKMSSAEMEAFFELLAQSGIHVSSTNDKSVSDISLSCE